VVGLAIYLNHADKQEIPTRAFTHAPFVFQNAGCWLLEWTCLHRWCHHEVL